MMQVGGVARMCLIAAVIAGISGLARGGEAGGSGGRKVNLLVVGDLGFPMPEQKLTAGAMAGYVSKSGLKFDATLVLGDAFKKKPTDGGEANFQDGFEKMYDARVLDMPFYAILGNHDFEYEMAEPAVKYAGGHPQSRWKMPARWYRVDLPAEKPLVTVLMLDSNKDRLSAAQWKAQMQWMEEQLSKPRAGTWLVCCGHNPLFSNGQHGDDKAMQAAWGPLLKKGQVDFYLSGHDHVLQHLQPEGWKTTFIGSGGGGENVKRPIGKKTVPFCQPVYGFAQIQFEAAEARVKLIDSEGKTIYALRRTVAGECTRE